MTNSERADIRTTIVKALKDGTYADARAKVGDVFVGAQILGASPEEALEVAQNVHRSAELRARAASAGGLLVGAREFIESSTELSTTKLRRAKTSDELDAIARQDQARHTEMLRAVLDGEISADTHDGGIKIPAWDRVLPVVIDVAFEDIVDGIEGRAEGMDQDG